MNAAHKKKMADRVARRFQQACDYVRALRDQGMKDSEIAAEARDRRNALGDRLFELDGDWQRVDAIQFPQNWNKAS